jgi:hypothetical protein
MKITGIALRFRKVDTGEVCAPSYECHYVEDAAEIVRESLTQLSAGWVLESVTFDHKAES